MESARSKDTWPADLPRSLRFAFRFICHCECFKHQITEPSVRDVMVMPYVPHLKESELWYRHLHRRWKHRQIGGVSENRE